MRRFLFLSLSLSLLAAAGPLLAHCDTVEGPVISDARSALQKGDISAVLKWVPAGEEARIRGAFGKTMEARSASPAARELADTWFFETLVRVHRQGEGEPYTGIRSGAALDPGIEAAEKAIAAGSVEGLSKELSTRIDAALQAKYQRLSQTSEHAGHNVEAGRAWVASYVDFMHYVEKLHEIATAGADAPEHRHKH
jgi:hypothetical protein